MFKQAKIGSLEFAADRKCLTGKLALADLSTLAGELREREGHLSFQLGGDLDPKGRPILRLGVQGALVLTCQRCLEPLNYSLDVQATYVLARNEQELGLFESEVGPANDVEAMLAPPAVDVASLVQDEVLLSLPYAPRHAEEECEMASDPAKSGQKHSFAVLQGLNERES
jgi:uncharacterized protein